MKWVKATTTEGNEHYVNLEALPAMLRTKVRDPQDETGEKMIDATIIFLGGIAIDGGGAVRYATTFLVETPEQLLGLPEVQPEEPKPKRLKAVKGGRR